MNKDQKVRLSIVGIIVIFSVLFGALYLLNQSKMITVAGYDTKPLKDAELETVYLGQADVENEILLVFDYSCVYCHEWMNDIFPSIEQTYIDTEQVKFRTQPMVYLNDQSLKLANFDQNLKRNYPELYFPILKKMMNEYQLEDWGSEVYLKQLIYANDLDHTLLDYPKIDALNITREYTKALDVEGVPTAYVNGVKMKNPFDLKELKSYLD